MEDNTSYTYTYDKTEDENKPERSLKLVFAIVIVVLLIFSILLGVLAGINKTTTPDSETTTGATVGETTTLTPSLTAPVYKTGEYSVDTDGFSLIFRSDHSKQSEAILEIADKTKLTITEIYTDLSLPDSNDERYWGKTVYLGHTGWLNMKYLKKEYSENIILPSDPTVAVTTTETPTEIATAPTEAPTNAPGNVSETSTAAPTSTTVSQSRYSIGDYKVSTGGAILRFKKEPGRNTEVILSIEDGTQVSVLEVVEINETDDVYRYWGKISYKGHTGYVSMAYLTKS